VRIQTPIAAEPLEGEVLQITSQADIQKNTLQVKVAVASPPPALRPDMLVQATFLASAPPRAAEDDPQRLRLIIPRQLVETADGTAHVWVADLADKVARKKAVQVGRADGDFVEVTQGLTVADRLILEGRQGLRDGQRIAVTFADAPAASIPNRGARPGRAPNPAGKVHHSGKQ
jgi:multidrug efflux pump subunit AcrA (membrane-fusion protein)